MRLDHRNISTNMKQLDKTFDTVKIFRGIKTQLSEKLNNMNGAEVTDFLATYNETYYNQSIAETRLKYKDEIDKMSFSEFSSFLKNKYDRNKYFKHTSFDWVFI